MPQSNFARGKNKFKKSLEAKIMKEAAAMAAEIVDITLEKAVKDIRFMYEEYIDKYYAYSTRYYYRHDTGRGSGTGMNLYRADMIKYDKAAGKVVVKISGEEMSPYKKVSTDHVLGMVIDGWRPMGTKEGKEFNKTSWSGSYSSDYYDSSGILRDALQGYIDNSNSILTKIGKETIREVLASNKYKYFR